MYVLADEQVVGVVMRGVVCLCSVSVSSKQGPVQRKRVQNSEEGCCIGERGNTLSSGLLYETFTEKFAVGLS